MGNELSKPLIPIRNWSNFAWQLEGVGILFPHPVVKVKIRVSLLFFRNDEELDFSSDDITKFLVLKLDIFFALF